MSWKRLPVDDDDNDVLSDESVRAASPKVAGAAKPLHRIARLFTGCLSVLFGFVWRYYWTRPRSDFWLGLPAVVVGCGLVGFVAIARQTDSTELIATYNRKAFEAFRAEDFEAADLYFQKMVHLDSNNAASQYGLALTAERRGQVSRARELMQRLAPADGTGDARAHFWLATHLAESKTPLDQSDVALLEHHLLQTVSQSPNHMQAHRMLTSLYASRKQYDKAVSHLDQVAAQDPAVLLTLARLNVLADRKTSATRIADKARTLYEELSKGQPANPLYRLRWAEAELFLLNYQQAAQIALAGLQQSDADNTAQWHRALTTVFVTWYDAVSKSDPNNLSQRLELLQQALGFGPNDPQVLSRLAEFAVQDNDRSPEAMAELKQILAAGRAPGIVHFILGTAALGSDDQQQGIHHLELAFQQIPQMPAVANNLAWAMANRAEPDLAKAEELVNVAIQLSPQHPEIRETRGQILAKLGKTKEAIVDLEFALRSGVGREAIHATLATLYDQLGDTELADQHRRMAD